MIDEFPHAEIHPVDEYTVELRYAEGPRRVPYRAWKMPVQEAADLAEWWTREGMRSCGSHTPTRNHRVGTIVVSMCSSTGVIVRSLDKYGNLKPTGYDLPGLVVEQLVASSFIAARRGQSEGQRHD